jgi:hypothetical protein
MIKIVTLYSKIAKLADNFDKQKKSLIACLVAATIFFIYSLYPVFVHKMRGNLNEKYNFVRLDVALNVLEGTSFIYHNLFLILK